MNIIARVRQTFKREMRDEIVVPEGPRLTKQQTQQFLLRKLRELETDKARLELAEALANGEVHHIRYVSAYYKQSWNIMAPGDARRHLEHNRELAYQHRAELNEIDPHPDFDRMYPNPTTHFRVA